MIIDTSRGGGGVLTSIIKVYTDVRLDEVYFSGLQVYEWVYFSLQKYIDGVSLSLQKYIFTQKVYEWVQFEK